MPEIRFAVIPLTSLIWSSGGRCWNSDMKLPGSRETFAVQGSRGAAAGGWVAQGSSQGHAIKHTLLILLHYAEDRRLSMLFTQTHTPLAHL